MERNGTINGTVELSEVGARCQSLSLTPSCLALVGGVFLVSPDEMSLEGGKRVGKVGVRSGNLLIPYRVQMLTAYM